ncbi:hypothetical protein [Candidatus Regiella insecticola]|uniref:Uncharacterized protein n=1 Tax=Candidatus Regiella insecticola TaxID=138073 RepID=A0A6L2ZLW0_9ENTR|nr:hypothetical protein [Candidatus Regiella insecticola]GFN45857.1 hypothetical protein RINTU1_12050 [Candidatus Regiella insecticola]
MLPAITSLTPSQILNPIDDFSGAPPGTAVQAASTAGILLTVGALLKAGGVIIRNVPDLIPQRHHSSAMMVANSMMVTSMAAIFADLFYLERLCDKQIECLPYDKNTVAVTNVLIMAVGVMLRLGLNIRNPRII